MYFVFDFHISSNLGCQFSSEDHHMYLGLLITESGGEQCKHEGSGRKDGGKCFVL